MRWIKAIATLLLFLWWVPATAHCRLGLLPALDFLSCCQHTDQDHQTPFHHDTDCAGDGCKTVESRLYKQETDGVDLFLPLIPAANSLLSPRAETQISHPQLPHLAGLAPPALVCGWRFLQRAAPSPRAPSFVS